MYLSKWGALVILTVSFISILSESNALRIQGDSFYIGQFRAKLTGRCGDVVAERRFYQN